MLKLIALKVSDEICKHFSCFSSTHILKEEKKDLILISTHLMIDPFTESINVLPKTIIK